MMGYGMGYGGGIGFLMMLLFFGILTAVVVALVRNGTKKGTNEREETPLDIARRRLAAGKITKAEYEELRRTLGT